MKRKTLYTIILIAAAVLLFATFFAKNNPTEEAGIATTMKKVIIPLSDPNEGLPVGTAELLGENNRTRISLRLTEAVGREPGTAAIYTGGCRSLGDQNIPIATLTDSEAETVLEVSIDDLKRRGTIALGIESASNPGSLIACGDIFF